MAAAATQSPPSAGPSVSVWDARLLLRVRTGSLVNALILEPPLLLALLFLRGLGQAGLVDVLVDPILRDRALTRITHATDASHLPCQAA